MKIEIVPSTVQHVRELSENIRIKDRREAEALGLKPNRALFYSYKHALVRHTLLIDDRVAAMWGLCGTPLGTVGQPYFVTGVDVEKLSPIRFARLYIRELNSLKNIFPVLENYVHSDYKGAVRMLRLAGFTLSEPVLINDNLFQRFTLVND